MLYYDKKYRYFFFFPSAKIIQIVTLRTRFIAACNRRNCNATWTKACEQQSKGNCEHIIILPHRGVSRAIQKNLDPPPPPACFYSIIANQMHGEGGGRRRRGRPSNRPRVKVAYRCEVHTQCDFVECNPDRMRTDRSCRPHRLWNPCNIHRDSDSACRDLKQEYFFHQLATRGETRRSRETIVEKRNLIIFPTEFIRRLDL